MECCDGGDLKTLLKNCKKSGDYICEDVIWKIFSQMLLALDECHNKSPNKVLHRDLKPANIFLDEQSNVKLGDFGLSRLMGDQSLFAYSYVGTPYYMSPEQIEESRYNEKSDIWSAGCLLYEMAALHPPFEATNHLSLAMKIKSGKYERVPMRYSDHLQKTIESMISVDPETRPTAEELLQIPQVAIRVREKKLKDKAYRRKIKEVELCRKEKELRKLELILKKKEDDLREQERRLLQKEQEIHMGSFKVLAPLKIDQKINRLRSRQPNSMSLNTMNFKNMLANAKKLDTYDDNDKENYPINGYEAKQRIPTSYETMQQTYKALKVRTRNFSGDFHDVFSNLNTRKSQDFIKLHMR